ncbi:HNH endonuclease [Bacillus thuringiensis]|uniref:HNH endonuclease n=1 Tax=Bacillus thuringiensis serovar andalousiensis TaxID=257985 RepID=A0A6H0TDC5_BACTU|nr:HNH endonuclease signature motif containing protein [Bacillus thuringiensis]QIW17176.1 HNH endonuclease [Bacillus thuringiensis serovar andalousiensis]
MNQDNPSRTIPQPVQREVRQRCGFGCVICGFPIYDYDHMKEWSKVREHVAEDITLLCPEHHRAVTQGLLPRQAVLEANQNPFNLRQGHSKPMGLYYEGDFCEFLIGGNKFTMDSPKGEMNQMIPIMVDGLPLLSFILLDGRLLLNAQIFDENNEVILLIHENQIVYSISQWDIQFVGKTLTLREKARKILINIIFETPNKVIIDKARLLCNGVEILVKEEVMVIGDNRSFMIGCHFDNCQGGVVIGSNPYQIGAGLAITHVNRYLKSSDSHELMKEVLEETQTQ